MDDLENKLLEIVFYDFDEMKRALINLGFRDIKEVDGTWYFDGASGIRSALMRDLDPVTRCVIIALCLFGMQWPFIVPGLLDKVKDRWSKTIKQTKKSSQKSAQKGNRLL